MESQEILSNYSQAYHSLYQRQPAEVRDLGGGWVLVNGARMTTEELKDLTGQLHKEINKMRASKRNVVRKLLKWFSTPRSEA